MRKSIRYYFFTSIATVLASSLLIMGLLQMYMATNYFRQEKEAHLSNILVAVEEGARFGAISAEDSQSVPLQYLADAEGIIIMMTDTAGNVMVSTDQVVAPLGTQVPDEILDQLYNNGTYSEMGTLHNVYQNEYYTMGMPLRTEDGALRGFVFASSDASGLQVYLGDMLPTFFMSAALALLVSSILAVFLANRTIIPIRRISAAARRFGEGDYTARVPVEGDDELAQLATTFNEMANAFEATDVSRRSFMGSIAHELRTPMTTIKGFIDGMLDGTIPAGQRDKYLGIVSEEVGRLSRLTRNMLDISRLEAGEYAPDTRIFNIWTPISAVIVGAEQRLEEKKVQLDVKDADAYVAVAADEDFVHQILFNLLDNALKFTEEDGTISISVLPGKNDVTISVRNTGAGIPPDTIAYVFDRFYKADKSRNTNVGGAGLGLHISKVLVNLMGGRIWVDSEVGEWSDFHFTLPAALAKKAAPKRREYTGRSGQLGTENAENNQTREL